MSRDFWTFAGLNALLTLLVGTTFSTNGMAIMMFVIAAMVATRQRSKQSTATTDSDPSTNLLRTGFLTLSMSLVASLAWRMSHYANDTANPLLAGADFVAHAMLLACLFWWAMQPHRGHVLMLGSALLLILASVIAGGVRQSLVGQLTLGVFTTAGFLAAASVILRSRSTEPASDAASGSGARFKLASIPSKSLFSLVVATGMLTATSLLARATSEVLPQIQDALQNGLNGTFEDLADSISVRGTRYVRGSRIGSIRDHMLAAPDEVALRVYAESSPGYLRGHVFHRLESHSWSTMRANNGRGNRPDQIPISPGSSATQGPRSSALNRFDLLSSMGAGVPRRSLDSTSLAVKTMEIHNRPEKGKVVFLPLTAIWIEAAADSLRFDANRRIVNGIDLTEPYVIGLTEDPPREELSPDTRRELLYVSRKFSSVTTNLARRLCGPGSSATDKAAAVAAYFQGNFEYSLEPVDRPPKANALLHFLNTQHPAHCEFFATATALILRRAGVPTRYVTGYVADEKSVEEDYYIARNRHSHAWVEAYDNSSKRWFPVESTPGRRYGSLSFTDELDDLSGLDDDAINRLDGNANGWIDWIQTALARSGITTMFSSAFRIAQLPLFVALLGLVWYRNRLRTMGSFDPAEVECAKMLRKADRRVRRHQLVRQPAETLHQFAERIERRGGDVLATNEHSSMEAGQTLIRMANWYRDFAVARYTGKRPESMPLSN